jgi:hypothetical protein
MICVEQFDQRIVPETVYVEKEFGLLDSCGKRGYHIQSHSSSVSNLDKCS